MIYSYYSVLIIGHTFFISLHLTVSSCGEAEMTLGGGEGEMTLDGEVAEGDGEH